MNEIKVDEFMQKLVFENKYPRCPHCRGQGFQQDESPHNGDPVGEKEACRCEGTCTSEEGWRQFKWDQRFLELARHVALWSKDPSTKTGAVLVRPDGSVASLGFNGFARGMDDGPELYENREVKYDRVVHCEMNAVLFCRDPLPLTGYTLYTTGPSCSRCAVHMVQAGIRRFVFRAPTSEQRERWKTDRTEAYFREVRATVIEIP